jgi:hypothetical protein
MNRDGGEGRGGFGKRGARVFFATRTRPLFNFGRIDRSRSLFTANTRTPTAIKASVIYRRKKSKNASVAGSTFDLPHSNRCRRSRLTDPYGRTERLDRRNAILASSEQCLLQLNPGANYVCPLPLKEIKFEVVKEKKKSWFLCINRKNKILL